MLGAGEADVVNRACELLVPGSAAARPDRYLASVLPALSRAEEDAVRAAIGVLAGVTDRCAMARLAGSAAFDRMRRLAIEAYYGPRAENEPSYFASSEPEYADVIVVGSGTGGGVIATELAARGIEVFLLDAGKIAPRVASTSDDQEIALLAGGESVAMRADMDIEPWYDLVEQKFGVRECCDWTPTVHLLEKGFAAVGATLNPLREYTLNAGSRPRHVVQHLLLDASRVTGVAYRHDGRDGVVHAPVVVLAAGALNTPQILLRTQEICGIDPESWRMIGRTLALHPARHVYGLFDEPQECRLAVHGQQRGFEVTGPAVPDPVEFAESLVDEANRPMWGQRLADTVAQYRYWAGLHVVAHDENTGQLDIGVGGEIVVSKRFSFVERRRMDEALTFAIEVLHAAGAREVVWSGLSTTDAHGSVPIGSVVDEHGRSLDIDGLYVGDGSLIPASLPVNPSLTIMALAARVAAHVAEEFAW